MILSSKIFGYYILLYACILKGAQGVIWPCQENKDCNSVIKEAKCLPFGNCRCPAGYVFSTNFTKCLKASLYGEKCEESVQCSHMPSGASCKKGVCECDDGFTYIRGQCRILNGQNEPCKEDNDCYFGYDRLSVQCKDNKCTCSDDYYHRYGNVCRRKSKGIGDACIVDEDCKHFEEVNQRSAKCVKNVCVDEEFSREVAIQTSFDNSVKETTITATVGTGNPRKDCKNDKDESLELKPLSEATENSESSSKAFGDECIENGRPCKGFENSVCVENLCYCKLGYYHDKETKKCLGELGEVVPDGTYCPPNTCYHRKSQTCVCEKKLYYYNPSLRGCRKYIPSFNTPCTAHSQCSPFGMAYCKEDATKKHCECEIYATYDPARQLCVSKEGVGAYCESDKQCQHIPFSYCSKENICVCQKYYIEKDEKCKPGINAECTKNEDCAVDKSVCIAISERQFCQCKKEYVHVHDKCLKTATEFGEECVDNEQCKPLLGERGLCIENKCNCDKIHHLSYGKCEEKREIGEKCTKKSECFTPSGDQNAVECKNSVCRCQATHTTDVEKKICIKPKANKSSGRPSCLKVITFTLIGAAFLITSAAIKQAWYE